MDDQKKVALSEEEISGTRRTSRRHFVRDYH